MTWWQILPLGFPAAGNSPYCCFSAFAGNPLLISPEDLFAQGLLRRADLAATLPSTSGVNYARAAHHKEHLLRIAWNSPWHRSSRLREQLEQFAHEQRHWLRDFSLFMALRRALGNKDWSRWPRELILRKASDLLEAENALREPIAFHVFAQFLFFQQMRTLRQYARSKGVKLIGDLPIFLAGDSADVWSRPELFLLDRQRRPKVVAGVPPDYFCKNGQRWGNPLYDWKAHQREGFSWWTNRLAATLEQVDLVRLDHFRGFAAAWHIPASSATARHGRWVAGPRLLLFAAVAKKLGQLPLVAEDLGLITPDVEKLRQNLGAPGMRVLQFAFGNLLDPAHPFLPHNFPDANTVVYTGTHDNDTTAGWFGALPARARKNVLRYLPAAQTDPAGELIRLAWSSTANLAIAPLQDFLRLGRGARMNIPGVAANNWAWRATPQQLSTDVLDEAADLTVLYGRAVQ